MAERRTVIRASHIVAYQDGGHRYLRDGVVVVEGSRIVDVGRRFARGGRRGRRRHRKDRHARSH